MPKPPKTNRHHASFEGIRRLDDQGNEYWSARQLSKVLEYSEYRHFLPVIAKARDACQNSGYQQSDPQNYITERAILSQGRTIITKKETI